MRTLAFGLALLILAVVHPVAGLVLGLLLYAIRPKRRTKRAAMLVVAPPGKALDRRFQIIAGGRAP